MNAEKYTENTRIALLEQSIGHINETLKDIKSELREIRSEIRDVKKEIKSDFLWTLSTMGGIVIILGSIMAKGFHWFS